MTKLINFLKTHPKKSIFACALAAYIYNYSSVLYKNEILRRNFCSSVKSLGDRTVSPTTQLHRLTVFLNPFARRGRLLKEFEKNVAPSLQLSGIDVQMVYTDNDGEIKDFVSVLDSSGTDGILIAGDDHVLQKAVSAMLQRSDFNNSRLQNIPVGVVPVGIWNTFAKPLNQSENIVEWCYNTLKPILHSLTRRHHILEVMAIPFISSESEKSPSTFVDNNHLISGSPSAVPTENKSVRKTSSLLGLEWSVWRDVEHGGGYGSSRKRLKPVDTNDHLGTLAPLSALSPMTWYRHLGVLRRHIWFWIVADSHPVKSEHSNSLFFEQNPVNDSNTSHKSKRRIRLKRAQLSYTFPCDGCSKCWQARQCSEPVFDVTSELKNSRSWFNRLFNLSAKQVPPSPPLNTGQSASVVEDRSTVINDECGRLHTLDLDDISGITLALDGDRIRVDVYRASNSLLNYIRATFSQLRRNAYQNSLSESGIQSFYCSSVRLYPQICENEYYWIDNDHFEACPVEVRVRRNAVNMYT